MNAKMMNPVITINGTARKSLVADRLEILRAVRDAMSAMQAIAPHGRDYVGQNERYAADRAIYQARFALLDQLHNEIEEEALSIHRD